MRPSTKVTADSGVMSTFTLYDRPSDHPDKFVIREWALGSGRRKTGAGSKPRIKPLQALEFDTLEEARAWCNEHHLTCVGRQANDDPVIVETWL